MLTRGKCAPLLAVSACSRRALSWPWCTYADSLVTALASARCLPASYSLRPAKASTRSFQPAVTPATPLHEGSWMPFNQAPACLNFHSLYLSTPMGSLPALHALQKMPGHCKRLSCNTLSGESLGMSMVYHWSPPSDMNCSMMFRAADSLMSHASLIGAVQSMTSPFGRVGRCTRWRSATSAMVPGTAGSLSSTGRLCGVGSGLGSAGSLSNALQRHEDLHSFPRTILLNHHTCFRHRDTRAGSFKPSC